MLEFLNNKLVLASHNQGKLVELKALLAPYDITLLSAGDFDLEDPIEDGDTFEANALLKAKFVANATGLPALADDSGLCINALDGKPGIYSARWAGESKDFVMAREKINRELGDDSDRSAHFITVLALVMPDGSHYFFEGKCEGDLTWPARGTNGFGYDPIFVPKGHDRTFGEMNADEKKALSHRAKAMQKMIGFSCKI